MCWPFPIEQCTAIAPYYTLAAVVGTILYVAFRVIMFEDIPATDGAVTISALGILAGIAGASISGVFPAQYAEVITTVITGLGYFLMLVLGPVAFAAIVSVIGAVAAILTHSLIGEYV